MLNEKLKTLFRKSSAAWAAFALCPVTVIAVFFLSKILSMKHFIFGDDTSILKWFREGKCIAFFPWESAKDGIDGGRFFPLSFLEFNIMALFSSDLTLSNLAERCFYARAGMWILICIIFLILMTCIAKMEKTGINPVLWLFVPLALLTLLYTPAFVSYFTMLIFPEARLCILFLLFFLFYYFASKQDKTIFYFLAWLLATVSIYGKENVLVIFAVICGVQFLFGWKELTRKHKIFLFSLPISIVIYLLLYYFLVFRHKVELYNAKVLWNQLLFLQFGKILCSYPIWIFAFLLGFIRLIRVVFYRERKHLFMDAVLFGILGFFISYLILKLANWWYWGVGVVVLMPIFFYWLIVCEKLWCRIAIFLVPVLCFSVTVKPAVERMTQTFLAQEKDQLLLKKIDGVKDGKRILFPAFTGGSQVVIEDACYAYLKVFLEKLGTPGKWRGNVISVRELPEQLTPEDICVAWRGAVLPPEIQSTLQINGFQSIAVCDFYEAFACKIDDAESVWKEVSPAVFYAPVNSSACLFGCGWAVSENWGRWTDGEQAKIRVSVPPALRGKNLKLTWNIYAFLHEKKPVCRIVVSTGSKQLLEQEFTDFNGSFTLHIPAEYTNGPRLPLTIQIDKPVSGRELGISEDPRRLGIGIKDIRMELDQ